MRLVSTLAVLICALACGSGSPPETAWTLVRIEPGDAACYIVLAGPDGTETVYAGDFDLCPGAPSDATGLIGQQVIPDIGKEKVMAGSCEGDPECTESEEVDFVRALRRAG